MDFVALCTNHKSTVESPDAYYPLYTHTHSSGSRGSHPFLVVDARALQPVLRAISSGSSTTNPPAVEERDVVLGNALQALPAVRESLAAAGVVLPSLPSSASSLASLGPETSPSQPPQRRRRGSSSSSSSSLAALAAAALAPPASPAAPPLGPAEMGEQVRQCVNGEGLAFSSVSRRSFPTLRPPLPYRSPACSRPRCPPQAASGPSPRSYWGSRHSSASTNPRKRRLLQPPSSPTSPRSSAPCGGPSTPTHRGCSGGTTVPRCYGTRRPACVWSARRWRPAWRCAGASPPLWALYTWRVRGDGLDGVLM